MGSQPCEDVMTDHPLVQICGIAVRPPGDRGLSPRHAAYGRAHRIKQVLRISLLEGMVLRVGEREVVLTSRKAKALVAYLVLTPGMKETRDRLVGLLWSETEDAKARASLRQLLHVLRDTFDAAGLVGLSTDRDQVSLDPSAVVTDLDDLIASVDRGEPADCLSDEAGITDSLLRGYDDVDPSFGSWLTVKREGIRRMLIRRLEAQLTEITHRPEVTKRIARALFQIDPTHEIACQELMRACVASGNAGSALAAYKQLWECLEQEYDIEPSMATQELVVAIKSGTYSPPMAALDPRGGRSVVASLEEAI
jgi:DNA-binding SARP family transcriptional activator